MDALSFTLAIVVLVALIIGIRDIVQNKITHKTHKTLYTAIIIMIILVFVLFMDLLD
ncbi:MULTISPECIES: hypothetical protein [Staphylococcus]|uniref:Mid2-like cell wall stress sensor domain protein n=1 Tax=Staphylococcus condimenti TaxID=70255 RepID=A0AB37H9M5_9STAP|nr:MULTISPECIES: hypothetical protein [Staphylococcus]MDK8644322.1 hypothetical protein [Staphylococcus condimenti]QQS81856.1 hypothetical protein I6J05_07945 [Staphylococcus condimenti]QRP95763.1 hypothetical protein I6J35_01090 [Staphylococcus condimenti]VEG63527.1 Uncharacterised protein [Staphylococcus condimenti]